MVYARHFEKRGRPIATLIETQRQQEQQHDGYVNLIAHMEDKEFTMDGMLALQTLMDKRDQ